MPESGDEPLARPKKKEKVRSVWISFAGRIVAQIIGMTEVLISDLAHAQTAVELRRQLPLPASR